MDLEDPQYFKQIMCVLPYCQKEDNKQYVQT